MAIQAGNTNEECTVNGKQRKIILARLAQLEKRDGRLTPEAVVEDAKKAGSPLRAAFPDERVWDDTWAAHQHRLSLARGLIARVRVETRIVSKGYAVPIYVHDPDLPAKTQGYTALGRIKKRSDTARELLDVEFKRVRVIMERVVGVAEEIGLRDELDQLINETKVFQELLGMAAA